MTSMLEIIAARTRAELPQLRDEWNCLAREPLPAAASGAFSRALRSTGLSIIAEIKRQSPSAGPLAREVDPAARALEYARGGAVAVSVVTQREFFGGSARDLAAVTRVISGLPVLQKDFFLDLVQFDLARARGADAVLIIAALVGDRLQEMLAEATRRGLDCLVEVHSENELDAALAAGSTLIGINNRNLRTLQIDLGTALALIRCMPPHVTTVAESGIRSIDDVRRMRDAGFHAILVGEAFMRAENPAALVEEFARAGSRS